MKLRWPYWLSWIVFFAFAGTMSIRMADDALQAVINFTILGGVPTLAALWFMRTKKDRP
jgi:hypothetical protein